MVIKIPPTKSTTNKTSSAKQERKESNTNDVAANDEDELPF